MGRIAWRRWDFEHKQSTGRAVWPRCHGAPGVTKVATVVVVRAVVGWKK